MDAERKQKQQKHTQTRRSRRRRNRHIIIESTTISSLRRTRRLSLIQYMWIVNQIKRKSTSSLRNGIE